MQRAVQRRPLLLIGARQAQRKGQSAPGFGITAILSNSLSELAARSGGIVAFQGGEAGRDGIL